jgi:outer membrane receptor for ferrienterochelin and colicins
VPKPQHSPTLSLAAAVAAGLLAVSPQPASAAEPEVAAPVEPSEPSEPSGRTEAAAEDEVVVTGTRSVELRRRSLVKVDVVTRDEAQRRGATNVGEALAGQLGLQVNPSAYGALGRPAAAQMGGLDRDRVLVLEDGERVVGDFGGAIDLAQMPLGGVSRIEVVEGPTSALYGTSAIGGVINVISGPPELEGLSGRLQLEARYPWLGLGVGELAWREDDAWAAAEASFVGARNIALSPPDTSTPDLYRLGAGVRVGTSFGRGHDASLRVRFTREASEGLSTEEVPGLGRFFIDLPEATDRLAVTLRDRLVLGPGHSLRLSLAKQWFWNESGRDRRDSPIDDLRSREHTMHSGELVGSFFEGQIVSGLVGARAEVESFEQSLSRVRSTGGELSSTDQIEVEPTTLGQAALYGQARVDPVDALSLSVGARLEASPRHGATAAPRVALAIRPSERLTLRLAGGRGYRVPSAKEVGFTFDHSSIGYRVIGNPDLQPETSWGLSGDISARVDKRLELLLGGYANWVDQLIDLRLAPGSATTTGVADYTYVNVGEARTAGFTAGAKGRVQSWLRAEVGYAYLFTRDEEAQRPLPGRPPHTLLSSLHAEAPIGLEVYLRARTVLDAYLDDELRAPGFSMLDLRLSQALGGGFRAYVGALNLLDSRRAPTRLGDQRPIEGRSFYLGVEAALPRSEP